VHLSSFLSERELRHHVRKVEQAMAASQAGEEEATIDRAQVCVLTCAFALVESCALGHCLIQGSYLQLRIPFHS
jgi:hypothetical protein